MRHILIALGLALTLAGCAAIPPYYDRDAMHASRDALVCETVVHRPPGPDLSGNPPPPAYTVCMALLGWPETP
jgi:hypothetical protein